MVEVLLRRWFFLRVRQAALLTAVAAASCNVPGRALWNIMNRVPRTRERVGLPVVRWQHGQTLHDEPKADMGLKDWITRYMPGGAGNTAAGATEVGPSLAVAALLVEVLRADYDVAPAERQQVMASVSTLLGLGAEETQALVEEAERHIDKSHDLYQFTSQINRAYSEHEKVRLLEALWRVADADATVHKYEEHLIRRVADLLHVPHSGFIAAKLRAVRETTRG
ncbi:MAG: hypothetical protein RL261_897 [Pseudomonadota bacterium]